MTPERRPMTDEEFERLLAARVRAEKAAANSPEAVKARRLDAARKRVFERQADVMSRTQMLPAGGQALAQVGALMVGDPATVPMRALAARDQMGDAASAIGRGAMDAGKAIGGKAQGLASALAADPQAAARAAFVAPGQALMAGARYGASALQAAPQAAQAVATDAQSIGQRVQGLRAPTVSREQVAAAVRAAPGVLGSVASEVSGVGGMRRGFDAAIESEARGMAGDYRGANLATMRSAGELAMGGSSVLGVGAAAAPLARGVARGGAALGARLAKKPPAAAAPPTAAGALPKPVPQAAAPVKTQIDLAAEQGYSSPLPFGKPAYHASLGGWGKQRNPVIDINRGEGFGFHVGTRDAALDRVNRARDKMPPTLIDVVTQPGRAINLPDLGNFAHREYWGKYLEPIVQARGADRRMMLRDVGVSEEEFRRIWDRVRTQVGDKTFARDMRALLLDMGIDRVQYRNAVEGGGEVSVALLNPGKVRQASKAKFDPAKKGQSGLLLGTGAGVGIGGLALTAPDALAQTRQQVEDQYVQADGRAPIRPDGGRAMRAGFMQGMSLDWSDEIARALAGKTPEERALLQERIAIAREQGATPEELAQLMQAEYEADRVGWESRASPGNFAAGRVAGEMATGGLVALGAAMAGNRFLGPVGNNLVAGGIKGLAYGGGAGTRDNVTEEERLANAGHAGAISALVSAAAVPMAQTGARWADNSPIAYQNWRNTQRAAKGNPLKNDARRLIAKRTSELAPDLPAEEAVQLARLADAARAGQKGYVPITPRLEALARGNQAGADAMRAAAAPAAKTRAAATPRAKPEPSQGDALAADLALYGELRLRADRGEATPADLQEMAKVKKRTEMPTQPRQPAAKAAKPAPMPMLQPLPPGQAGPEVLENQGRDFVPPRMNSASAAKLGAALAKPGPPINPRVPSDPLSPQKINLQKMTVRDREEGMRPEPRKSQYVSPGDYTLKGLATSFSIPVTGWVQENITNPVLGMFDGRSEFARDYDEERKRQEKQTPLGADPELRKQVAGSAVAAQQADLAKKLADAEPTARAAALAVVAKAENEVALLKAATTPTYSRRTLPTGETVRVYSSAYRAAVREAKNAGLTPSAEALKAARERLKAVSGEAYVEGRVSAALADLTRQQRAAEAQAAALQRR